MFLKHQIIKSEWFLKDHVMLETGVMTTENSEKFIINKLYYKTYWNSKYCNNISTLLGYCFYCIIVITVFMIIWYIYIYIYNSLGVQYMRKLFQKLSIMYNIWYFLTIYFCSTKKKKSRICLKNKDGQFGL